MEDLLLNSFLSFFFIGVIGYLIAFSTAPETPTRPSNMLNDKVYASLYASWKKTKEAKDFHKWHNTWWKMIVYWFYIMLAHGVIFFIMLISS